MFICKRIKNITQSQIFLNPIHHKLIRYCTCPQSPKSNKKTNKHITYPISMRINNLINPNINPIRLNNKISIVKISMVELIISFSIKF
jgi:hypothetical protein